MTEKKILVGIAEDHLLVRQGMVSLLGQFDTIEVVFSVANGKELLESLKDSKPDIILLDIEMPLMSGSETYDKIKQRYPKIKIIIISAHFKDLYIIEFIKKGACGFLNKNCGIDKIMEALCAVNEQGFYYDSTIAMIMATTISNNTGEALVNFHSETGMTNREIEIIQLICLNKSNKEIADTLNISIRTVEGHRLHIMKKTNTKNALALTTYALQHNLVRMTI